MNVKIGIDKEINAMNIKFLKIIFITITLVILVLSGCTNVGQTNNSESAKKEVIMAKRQLKDFTTDIQTTEKENYTTVKTSTGLEYTAEGYKSLKDGKFAVKNDFTITFEDGMFADPFNRYTICYESSRPLKGTVSYEENGKLKTEYFFLEAGKDTFSCLIEDYLSGGKGINIKSLTFESLSNRSADFVLCDLTCEEYKVYADNTYYINNERFKVGIRLLWGGGINYISDKKNPIKDLDNLINQADEGRLVQQSYYGTQGNHEYKPGFYNNAQWSYNPVQGGDKNGNHSRIVDIVVEDYSVYIKAQPQDWSLNNALTPSYMENCYTIFADYIRVDNRFVDFSGWQHRDAHQELPAFYTVSYLDKFTWYDGEKPWENDALSSRNNLRFWGDPQYSDDCSFALKEDNTETWCSWTNSKDDYGIGLYVPNVELFLAGRNAYNASKDSFDGACNYVAPINTLKLVSFEPLEYSYLMATGSVNEIREIFKVNKDFTTNASLDKK